MKPLITIFFISTFFVSHAQEDKRTNYSPYGQTYGILNASMSSLAQHGKLTQFTYYDMNFVNERFQDYLSRHLSLVLKDEPIYEMSKPENYIIEKYEKSIQANFTKPRSIKVRYNVFPEGNYFIIKSCVISGYWEYILDLYVKYWNTTFNFEAAKKGEVVVNYLIQDRIALSLNLANESGKITITNTTIKDVVQYREVLKKNLLEKNKIPIQENKLDSLKKQ